MPIKRRFGGDSPWPSTRADSAGPIRLNGVSGVRCTLQFVTTLLHCITSHLISALLRHVANLDNSHVIYPFKLAEYLTLIRGLRLSAVCLLTYWAVHGGKEDSFERLEITAEDRHLALPKIPAQAGKLVKACDRERGLHCIVPFARMARHGDGDGFGIHPPSSMFRSGNKFVVVLD